MQLGLDGCHLCPRRCGAGRDRSRGYCGAPDTLEVASVCLHRGEEPPLAACGGIVNVFFAHCNLQCIYCQNHAIAGHDVHPMYIHHHSVEEVADKVTRLLPQGNGLLGLVTAAHYAHQIPSLLDTLHRRGQHPTVVYNSSGYEQVDTLRALEGTVDIYLPDLKYMDPALAEACSHAPDYPEVAAAALLEMQRQVGASLKTDDRGVAFRGMVVRHLVLPGQVANTRQCLEWLADHFPQHIHVSLMAQYYPPSPELPPPLDRPLSADEYLLASDIFARLGFSGWRQELEAESHYRPDFANPDNPFEPTQP